MNKELVSTELEEAIHQLKDGGSAEISAAYTVLQSAVLGREGCLRTDKPIKVDWADAVWADFVSLLAHESNHVRSIAGQMLSNLSQSTKPSKVLRDFDKLESVTHDEKFVTARHVLQSLWKVGLTAGKLRSRFIEASESRYRSCVDEKNSTLVRFDIVVGLRSLFDIVGDDSLKEKAEELIELETDLKYKKKYAGVWRNV